MHTGLLTAMNTSANKVRLARIAAEHIVDHDDPRGETAYALQDTLAAVLDDLAALHERIDALIEKAGV